MTTSLLKCGAAWGFPAVAILFYGFITASGLGTSFAGTASDYIFALILLLVLLGAVFASVHHAEVIAHRTGEPYGTLVLSVAVTVIEVALITSIMLSERSNPALARDTVFAVVMIVCNGLVGMCILAGGLRHHEQGFRVTGASAYLVVIIVMATLTLVLPNYTQAISGPAYSPAQLAFVSVSTLALYMAFLYIQTVRNREYFILGEDEYASAGHAPSFRAVTTSALLLLVALTGVILLAKTFAVVIEAAINAAGAPLAAAGVIVALLILLPEGLAALQAAKRDQLQKSLNLALGSSIATIGLTVPIVAVVAIALDIELVLGLEPKEMVLLALTILVSLLTFGTGRTNILYGFVHLVIFATFTFLVFVP